MTSHSITLDEVCNTGKC